MAGNLLILGGAAAGLAAITGVLGQAVFSPKSQLFGPVRWHGDRNDPPRVSITFDDGPDPVATPQVLDILTAHNAKAAFFVIGRRVQQYPEIVSRISSDGHLIGNHSFSHEHLAAFRGTPYWQSELIATDNAIEANTGRRPAYFRPPMGIRNPPIMRAATHSGHHVITWSRRARDGWNTTSDRILRRLADSTSAGDIVLFHDGSAPRFRRNADAMIEALPRLIEHWRGRGLNIVRLDELLGVTSSQIQQAQSAASTTTTQ